LESVESEIQSVLATLYRCSRFLKTAQMIVATRTDLTSLRFEESRFVGAPENTSRISVKDAKKTDKARTQIYKNVR
jgi:hypothetical protein